MSSTRRLGQSPTPAYTLLHLSDAHFLADKARLFGSVDTDRGLVAALARIEKSLISPDAIVVTGDLADLGESDAYVRLKSLVDPVAERLSVPVVWVMGNHDVRTPFAAELFGEDVTDQTQDRVWHVGGLRIIALDTSVPGYNHGELTDHQLDWLAAELSVEAPVGTILAMHHPPISSPIEIMGIIELQERERLGSVLAGSDVRAILAGHLHNSTYGTFAGIPVSVAAATCYTLDVGWAPDEFKGVDGSQSFNLVEVFADHIVHSIIPAFEQAAVSGYTRARLEELRAMTPDERVESFSRQRQPPQN
ncbi:MAG: phosphodiesterase [bacterium]|nr:phosphodiesterase [bacterium]